MKQQASKLSNGFGWACIVTFCGATLYQGCSGTQPQVVISEPASVCANALVLSPEVRAQAAKLGIEPAELAQQACSAAMLGIKLAEVNLRKAGTAGAPPIVESGLAGAAGGP